MNYDEFVSKHIGKETDYDGVYGVQCVDLIKAYLYEVFAIKPGAWGDARCYYEQFNIRSPLKNNFTKIANSSSFVPQKGDICVWNKNISKSNNCGHIAIATGDGDVHTFYTYDQNWNGKCMKKVEHNYHCFYGVLRPKDQSKMISSKPNCSNESCPILAEWKNGSTKEKVYKKSNCTEKIGTLYPYDKAKCIGKSDNSYIVMYDLTGGYKKVGFVKYRGGVTCVPVESRSWENGSTPEYVYADNSKKLKIGKINPYEKASCLGKIGGKYIVLYNITNTNIKKVGFVDYHG